MGLVQIPVFAVQPNDEATKNEVEQGLVPQSTPVFQQHQTTVTIEPTQQKAEDELRPLNSYTLASGEVLQNKKFAAESSISPKDIKTAAEKPTLEQRKKEREEMMKDLFEKNDFDYPKEIDEIIRLHEKGRDLNARKFILLAGPAGTGKTTMAAAIAKKLGFKEIEQIKGPFLTDRYQNGGEHNLKQHFDRLMERYPCALVIDEIEALLNKHDQQNNGDNNILRAFWTKLDECNDLGIMVIATSNYTAKDLPGPIQSRFDIYKVEFPHDEQRKKIINFHLEHYKKKEKIDWEKGVKTQLLPAKKKNTSQLISSIFFPTIISKTKNFSTRLLKRLVGEAAISACLRDNIQPVITVQDFMQAIPKVEKNHENLKDSKTWGQWWDKNYKFVIGTGVAIGTGATSTYFAYKQLQLGNKSHNLNVTNSTETSIMHTFNRIISYWNTFVAIRGLNKGTIKEEWVKDDLKKFWDSVSSDKNKK